MNPSRILFPPPSLAPADPSSPDGVSNPPQDGPRLPAVRAPMPIPLADRKPPIPSPTSKQVEPMPYPAGPGAGEDRQEIVPKSPKLPRPAPLIEKKPNGTWQRLGGSALSVSFIAHLIFILLAIFFFVRWVEPPPEEVKFLPGGGGGGGSDGTAVHKIQHKTHQQMASETRQRIASVSTTAAFSLPDASPELTTTSLPMDFGAPEMGTGGGTGGGRGTGHGTGIGSGTGSGKGGGIGQLGIGTLIPTIMRGRCTDQARLMMLKEAGGTPAVEEAVKKSLAWLKRAQNPDGSWGSTYPVAMTGLVLLCYFGHCEGILSSEYGDTVSKGITYLVNSGMRNQGKLASGFADGHWVYEHAIATYALAEALTISRNLEFPIPELESTVKNAATFVINGQAPGGGWDYGYQPSGRNDLSVAGWQLQALKAAKASGVKLDGLDQTIRKSITWLEREAYLGDGKFAYTDKTARVAMIPVGALCLQQWDKWSSRGVREPVEHIMSGLELRERANDRIGPNDFARLWTMHYDGPNCDLYAWYYAVQVMRNAGGREWKAMNKAILAEIVPAQNSDGSFRMENTKVPRNTALVHISTDYVGNSRAIYVQTLNTLILEVYYRFLPATSAGTRHHQGIGADHLEDLR